MCGIYGFVRHGRGAWSKYNRGKAWAIVNDLAVLMAARGTDSTGVAHVRRDGSLAGYYRALAPSWSARSHDGWRKVKDCLSDDTLAVLGHTRLATHGAVTIANAHPFVIKANGGPLVGIHNGVVANHAQIAPGHESDSRALFEGIARHGLRDVMAVVQGSSAVVVAHRGRVSVARTGSPMWTAKAPALGLLLFCSTREALVDVAKWRKVQLVEVQSLPVGVVFDVTDAEPQTTGEFGLSQCSIWDEWERPSRHPVREPERAVAQKSVVQVFCYGCRRWVMKGTTVVQNGCLRCKDCVAGRRGPRAADARPADRKFREWEYDQILDSYESLAGRRSRPGRCWTP